MSVKAGVVMENKGTEDEWIHLAHMPNAILVRTGIRYYRETPAVVGTAVGRVFLSGRIRLL